MKIGLFGDSIESTLSPQKFITSNVIPVLLKNKANKFEKKV